jgi:hypothetical protein
MRIFASTGSVVLAGILGATAASPSCSFSLEIVKRIPNSLGEFYRFVGVAVITVLFKENSVVTAGYVELFRNNISLNSNSI